MKIAANVIAAAASMLVALSASAVVHGGQVGGAPQMGAICEVVPIDVVDHIQFCSPVEYR